MGVWRTSGAFAQAFKCIREIIISLVTVTRKEETEPIKILRIFSRQKTEEVTIQRASDSLNNEDTVIKHPIYGTKYMGISGCVHGVG